MTPGITGMAQIISRKCCLHGPVPKVLNGYTPLSKMVTGPENGNEHLIDISSHVDGGISKSFHRNVVLMALY